MKEFDLFKWLIIFTIIGLTIAAIGTIEFNGNFIEDIKAHGEKPLQLTNWHYTLLLLIIWVNGSK